MDHDLIVDREFQELLEPHTAEEIEQLRENIRRDGKVIDPIIVWEGTNIIVDGMTRYGLAVEMGFPYERKLMHFENRDAVKLWIYSHQFGRRNGDGLAKSRWRAMLVQSKTSGTKDRPPVAKTAAVTETAKETKVSERQVWTDVAVTDVLTSLPAPARKVIETGRIAATAEDILKIEKLPESQKSQVIDLLENMPDVNVETVAFRSVEELIDTVIEHQTNLATKPVEVNKLLEQEVAKVEKVIAELPARIDKISQIKKLQKSPWKERAQKAFAGFVAIWREQCRKDS